jgi:hypothetical protein
MMPTEQEPLIVSHLALPPPDQAVTVILTVTRGADLHLRGRVVVVPKPFAWGMGQSLTRGGWLRVNAELAGLILDAEDDERAAAFALGALHTLLLMVREQQPRGAVGL